MVCLVGRVQGARALKWRFAKSLKIKPLLFINKRIGLAFAFHFIERYPSKGLAFLPDANSRTKHTHGAGDD
jgi:hypothetical protein